MRKQNDIFILVENLIYCREDNLILIRNISANTNVLYKTLRSSRKFPTLRSKYTKEDKGGLTTSSEPKILTKLPEPVESQGGCAPGVPLYLLMPPF